MTVALLDACVLYPPSLRDLLIRLAADDLYEPRWTDAIQEEWIRNVLSDNASVTEAQLTRTRRLMDQAIPTALVSGYERHMPSITLSDADDQHVLAAAIEAAAEFIVTFNLSDFPAAILSGYGIRAVHPDIFLSAMYAEFPEDFLQTVQTHRTSLKRPPKTAMEYIITLNTNRLHLVASRLSPYTEYI
jgi:predicted nucleic acid-binding protein